MAHLIRQFWSFGVGVALGLSVACGSSHGHQNDNLGSGGATGGPVWTADSVAIEAWFKGAVMNPMYGWAASANELTGDEQSLLGGLVVAPGARNGAACDVPSFEVYVTDGSGTHHYFRAIAPECSAEPVISFNAMAELTGECPSAVLSTSLDAAPTVQVGRCRAVSYATASDLWARFSLPAGARYAVSAVDNHGGSQDISLLVYDSTGTSLLGQAPAGQSLTLSDARDYAVQLHDATGNATAGTLVALALGSAP
jgi:hypothetical protein